MEFLQVLASGCVIGGVDIDETIISLLNTLVTGIKIVVPILLVIWGMLDLGKAVIAQKEDDIKSGQKTFMKRSIAAAILFFIPAIVKLVVGIVGGDDQSGITDCFNAIL